MKEDGELGVSDDKESIFSTLNLSLKSRILKGMKEEKNGPQKQGHVIFIFEDTFVRIYKDSSWFMKTISVYRPAPLLIKVRLDFFTTYLLTYI